MNYFKYFLISVVLLSSSTTVLQGQVHNKSWENITRMEEGDWFASKKAIEIAENVLLYQRNIGGWPKNIQMQEPLSNDEKEELFALKKTAKGCTTDNGATYEEMVFLSKIYRKTPDERYKNAFLKGLDYILEAQYENGGWPQFYPLKKGYYSHITFNDDSMVNILNMLKDIKNKTNYFSIQPPEDMVEKTRIAFDKGIDCILKTQYQQNGVLTSWCAQYDEKTLLPAKARSYELPSLSGKESAQIVLLLMSIKNPSESVKKSIINAVQWFEKVKIKGQREEKSYNEKGKIIDKKMIPDSSAPDLWARFMELDDNTPFFCDRDGIKKASLDEIGAERRNGYAWYTNEPKEVFKKYTKWKKKFLNKNVLSEVKVVKSPKDQFNVSVAKDGTGDYTSIQEAINDTKSFPYQRVTIFVKNGVYYEKVKIHEWNTNISLIGESKEHTIISYDDFFNKIDMGRNSTFYTYTLLVAANDFYAANLTIQNTSGRAGQAVALSVFSDRVVIYDCNIVGNQDTLNASGSGKQYYKDCYIEGTTDFIFGSATALFENCTIHSMKNSYITAASTPKGVKYGYVFKNCNLTAEENVTDVFLGRPWRKFAKTVFINCEMGNHIKPKGWHNWSKPEAELTAFYAEYKNMGEGFKPNKRVSWSHLLKRSKAKKYTIENILGSKKRNSEINWYSVFKKFTDEN